MYLIYFDESGNTGNNLADTQQPVFVLAALMVPDHVWTPVEQELETAIAPYFPHPRPNNFEIHATELRNGHGIFSNIAEQTGQNKKSGQGHKAQGRLWTGPFWSLNKI